MSSATEMFTLRGRVVQTEGETQLPVPEVVVKAFDYDRGKTDDELGEVRTGEDGSFTITFAARKAGGRSEGEPEAYLRLYTQDGRFLDQTPWSRLSEPEFEFEAIDLGKRPDPGRPKPHGDKTREVLAPHSSFYQGPFGRMFRELTPWEPPGNNENEKVRLLQELASTMHTDDRDDATGDNLQIPAAYTYFGQFVDHDITFDPGSDLQKRNDPERLHNFRTPRFDLDNLYGGGFDDEPFLYDRRGAERGKFVLGKGCVQTGTDEDIDLFTLERHNEDDLPRNQQGVALVGDPRNDENIIVSQLQLAFLKFHNKTLEWVKENKALEGKEAFREAQKLVRWHYQWVVLFDYLPLLIGEDALAQLLTRPGTEDGKAPRYQFNLEFYKWKNAPYMPVEFSVAAYRFGHSQVRARYDLNQVVRGVAIFRPPSGQPRPLDDLRGGRPLPRQWSIDWRRLLELDGAPLWTRKIDTKLSGGLAAIAAGPGGENRLAFLNLLRGWRMGLPSGEAVAKAMGLTPLTREEIGLDPKFGHESPLWYYILREAEVTQNGDRLGVVGGRIVGEVLVGLAKGDPNCFVNVDPLWTPEREGMIPERGLEFKHLIRFAGLGSTPF